MSKKAGPFIMEERARVVQYGSTSGVLFVLLLSASGEHKGCVLVTASFFTKISAPENNPVHHHIILSTNGDWTLLDSFSGPKAMQATKAGAGPRWRIGLPPPLLILQAIPVTSRATPIDSSNHNCDHSQDLDYHFLGG